MRILLFLALAVLALSRGITFSELQQELIVQLTSPLVSLTFVYDGTTQNGPLYKQLMQEIAEKKEGYFKLIAIDCDTDDEELLKNFPYCSSEIRPKLPALFYTEPVLNPSQLSEGEEPKNHMYAGNLQQKALYEFAIPLMKLYSVPLKKSSDWVKFQEKYPETPKVLYFTDKDKISPFYKALTGNFRKTIAFAHIFKNSSLCQELGVASFPTLLLNGDTDIQMTSNLMEQVEILRSFEGPKTQIIIEDVKESTNSLDEQNLQEKIYQNPQHILIHIPGADGKVHNEWKKCQDSFKKMFTYFESQTLAKKFGVKHRPAIVYFPKSLVQKDIKKTIFHPSDNFRVIYDQISGLIEDFTVPVSDDLELQQLTSLHLRQDKLIAVLFHSDEISLSYRVLSNDERFKEQITFIRMKDPAQDVLDKFQIKKLPALFIMTTEKESEEPETTKKGKKEEDGKKEMKLQLAQFTGRFNFDELQTYLKYFITKPESSQENRRDVIEFDSKKKFDKGCLGQNCYLLLLDGSPDKAGSNEEFIQTLKGSMNDILQNVGYVDAKCHSELLTKLQIYAEELPVLVYLNNKFEKYSRLVGRIQKSSIEIFKAKVKINKGIWRVYEKLSFEKKNCVAEHQKLKQLESSGSKMTAVEAEILEEIKKEEEQKKEEVKFVDKSSRRRKKRRPKEEDSEL